METMYAFTDESGSHGFKFDKKDVSQYFIVSAVIVEESKIAAVEQEVENIRERYFQKGEMKSSSVGKNHGRRKVIIEQLQNIDFNVFAIVVDKKQIYKDSGLMYKETFYRIGGLKWTRTIDW